MNAGTLKERADTLARSYLDQGVTFDYAGEERPFPLDAVPRVISAHEWQVIESGVVQRVTALESFLDDIYSREGEIPRAVHEGVIPWRLIASSKHYHRAVMGIRPTNGVRVHVAGVDLIRDEEGTFRVLEDNVRVPSGVSYVIANRRAMANVFPEAFATMRIRPVHDYPRMLLAALRASAPDGASDPTVVVLTPGVFNSAYFEHALLARMMGVELVEGRDLVCVGGQVRMRTTTGDQPVDVIYRRVDDEFLDPVHFRGDSVLGVAGLVSAMRSGRVTVANAVGNGVADDKLDLLLPARADPVLPRRGPDPAATSTPSAATRRPPCGTSSTTSRRWSSSRSTAPAARAWSSVRGPTAPPSTSCASSSSPTRAAGSPSRSCSSRPCRPSSTAGSPRATSTCARSRSTTASAVRVLPGGLTRVALPEGELVVNSSQGGGSKDTWVLSDRRPAGNAPSRPPDNREVVVMSAPTASHEDSMRAAAATAAADLRGAAAE